MNQEGAISEELEQEEEILLEGTFNQVDVRAPEEDPEEGEMIAPDGLGYGQVKGALNGVIQKALHCARPEGMDSVHLTFDLIVGCDGVVSGIETVDDGNAPQDYVRCVSDVIAKADFPPHDMENGMPVTYPVNVNW